MYMYVQKTDGVDLIVENPRGCHRHLCNFAVNPVVVRHGVEPLTSVLCPTFVEPCCTCMYDCYDKVFVLQMFNMSGIEHTQVSLVVPCLLQVGTPYCSQIIDRASNDIHH